MTTARDRAQRRRQLAADAETAYDSFLSNVATPLVKQIANALNAEGYAFTLSTPGRGLRLALDRLLPTLGRRARVWIPQRDADHHG